MKRIILMLFLLVSLCLATSACKGENSPRHVEQQPKITQSGEISDGIKNDNRIDNDSSLSNKGEKHVNNNSSNKATTQQENKSSQNSSVSEEEQFYGEWVITKSLANSTISTYGKEDIEKMVGKRIIYTNSIVSFDGNELKNPSYKKAIVLKKDNNENNNVTFEELGIVAESVVSIEVFVDKEQKSSWEKPGSFFFIKDQNSMVLIDNGAVFELTREE